jgi:vitamin B12 transporter
MKQPLRGVALVATSLTLPVASEAQEDVFSLEGLVITASPTPRSLDAVARNVTVITAEELRSLGDRTLGEALRELPGVDVVRNGSFGAVTSVFLRGGESDHTLVLVDGVQVNEPGGGFDFASLSTDNVERVEITRGPASALYGSDAVAGVVHVITKTGRGPARATLSTEAGSFGRVDWSADVLGGTERAGYTVSVARRSTDGILAFNNAHASTVLSGRARLVPDDRTDLGVTVRLTDREFHFPTDGSGAVVDRNAFAFNDATQVRLEVKRELSGSLSVAALVGLHEVDGGTDDAQDGPADTLGLYGFTSLAHFRRVTGEVRAHVSLDETVLTAGFEVETQRQRSFTESATELGPSNGRSEFQRHNGAGFVHASGQVAAVAFSAGARLEDNERFGRMATWQAGVSWLALSAYGTRVRASVGTAIKEPTFFENFATGFAVGNPDLDPERSRSWEVGIEQPLFRERVTARATFFDQRFQDLIQFTFVPPAPGDPSYFNVGTATSRGLEFEVGGRFRWVSVGVSRTWLDTEVEDAGFDSGPGATFVEGEPLLRRPEESWALRAAAEVGGQGHVFARLGVVGERSDRDFSTFPASPVQLPGYEVLTVGGEWTLDGLASRGFTLQADNVLDEVYEEAFGFRAPGRGIYVGGRVSVGGQD